MVKRGAFPEEPPPTAAVPPPSSESPRPGARRGSQHTSRRTAGPRAEIPWALSLGSAGPQRTHVKTTNPPQNASSSSGPRRGGHCLSDGPVARAPRRPSLGPRSPHVDSCSNKAGTGTREEKGRVTFCGISQLFIFQDELISIKQKGDSYVIMKTNVVAFEIAWKLRSKLAHGTRLTRSPLRPHLSTCYLANTPKCAYQRPCGMWRSRLPWQGQLLCPNPHSPGVTPVLTLRPRPCSRPLCKAPG